MKDNYWINKQKRAEKAQLHTQEMTKKYTPQINGAINFSTIYNKKVTRPMDTFTRAHGSLKITIEDIDTVSAIIKYNNRNKIAALNFASYKHPGGMFLQGSSAQEESLCHSSFLFNVLSAPALKNYYDINQMNLNKGLYTNRAIYTPNVCFFNQTDKAYLCNIITCAAPNWSTAMHHASREENYAVLKSRIKFVLDIALDNQIETLILGAFGCGVFAQNPQDVATIFKEFLSSDLYSKHFSKIIFAIPDGKNGNLDAFMKVFQNRS